MEKNNSIFLKCNCGCSVLEIEYIQDESQFYFSLWDNGHTRKPMTKKERLRWCDHVMKTGNPWADHIIVNKVNARRIVKFLTKHIKYGDSKAKNTRIRRGN